MKLSNKILVGFFGLIFVYLTAVFAEIRLRGTPRVVDDTNSIAETAAIPGVVHLVLTNIDENINVIGSDQPRLEVRSFSGDLLQTVNYTISGDTLTLSGRKPQDMKALKISVFINQSSLKGMTVNGTTAIVNELNAKHLYLSQKNSRIWMSGSKIGSIHLEASGNSSLDISATDLDTLSADIEESHVAIGSPVRVLEGSMKRNSFLHASEIDEIRFKKDESSRLNLY